VTERQHEVALTHEEVNEILRKCGHGALLVGGQALAFWAAYYDVEPVGELAKKVTSDVDFIGTVAEAKKLGAALKWKVWLPSMDDSTSQTAKVTKVIPGGGVKQVDYLSGIVGLDTARIQARAVEVTLPSGAMVRILHPLDVLESRLRNLETLSSKRDATGIAQAELSIVVAGKFVSAMVDSRGEKRTVLAAVERIARIALDKGLVAVAVDYGIDPLAAVSASRIDSPEFWTRRWPQIQTEVAELRRKHAQRAARRPPARTARAPR
jgi:hypothetical protein